MRHTLVDYARSKRSERHGGGQERVPLDENIAISNGPTEELVALDEALRTLEVLDPRKGSVVELKFFGGLTNEEMAEVLDVSTETVKRDWRFARNWLLRELAAAAQK
jgi:RNA polymerase sigma factor (TIGR02999 family)